MDEINITLPLPPSLNKAFAGYIKRHKSIHYTLWEREADQIKIDYEIEGDEWLYARYEIYVDRLFCKNGTKRIIDCANYEKIATDYLAKRIKGFEDHKIKRITLEKFDCGEDKPFINIVISENKITNKDL